MRLITFIIVGFLANFAWSQNKVEWKTSFDQQTNEVLIEAKIEQGWHLYSQVLKNDVGPIPTTFQFEENKNVQLIGAVAQPKAIEAYDENFGSNLDYFAENVVFKQKVDFKKETILKGSVYYMVCDDQRCLPPTEVPFEIELKK